MEQDLKERETKARLMKSYSEEGPRLLALARKQGGEDAEDLVQEVLASALDNLAALANVQNIAAWLFRAVGNRAIDLWRRNSRRRARGETAVSAGLLEEIAEAGGFGPAETFERKELSDALSDAIAALPEEQRLVIQAQVFEGSSFRELSEATGLPLDTLAGRKRYAVRALGRALRAWAEDE